MGYKKGDELTCGCGCGVKIMDMPKQGSQQRDSMKCPCCGMSMHRKDQQAQSQQG